MLMGIAKADQSGWMPMLIWVFDGPTDHSTAYSCMKFNSLHAG